MIAAEVETWLNQGRLDEIPIIADAAEEVTDPERLTPGLAYGLRCCQVEGRQPVHLRQLNYPGGGDALYTDHQIATQHMCVEFMEEKGLVVRWWGWRFDAPPPSMHNAGRVDTIRKYFLHGTNGSPSSDSWRAYRSPTIAIAALGRISAAFDWLGPTGPLVVARSMFSTAFGRTEPTYHAIRREDPPTPGYNPPALCGQKLRWLSRWEWEPGQIVSCTTCQNRMRNLVVFHDRRETARRKRTRAR